MGNTKTRPPVSNALYRTSRLSSLVTGMSHLPLNASHEPAGAACESDVPAQPLQAPAAVRARARRRRWLRLRLCCPRSVRTLEGTVLMAGGPSTQRARAKQRCLLAACRGGQKAARRRAARRPWRRASRHNRVALASSSLMSTAQPATMKKTLSARREMS